MDVGISYLIVTSEIALFCVVVFLIAKYCGLLSFQGLFAGYNLILAVSDWIGLSITMMQGGEGLPFAMSEELAMRITPLFLQLVGFIIFFGGVRLVPNWSRNLQKMSDERLSKIWSSVSKVVILGFGLLFLGYYFCGVTSYKYFLTEMNKLAFSVKKYEFLIVLGTDFAFVSGGLLVACSKNKILAFLEAIFLVVAAVVLTTSKSGFQIALVPIVVGIGIFRPQWAKSFLKIKYILAAVVLFVWVLGVKTQLRYQSTVDYHPSAVTEAASSTLARRFGPEGLFRGYCQMVDSIKSNPILRGNGTTLYYGFASMVPRFIWPDKPDHPMRGLGYLTNASGIVDENAANTLTAVGMWYWDYGFWGMALGMLVTGFWTGFLQNFLVKRSSTLSFMLARIFFAQAGLNHGGPIYLGRDILEILTFIFLGWLFSVIRLPNLSIEKKA